LDQKEIILSVVICTYNRSDILQGAIESLLIQDSPASLFEIIVVDNNSSDSTGSICEEYAKKVDNFRYIFEVEQGLSVARNRGYIESRGRYVAYIDDDARVVPSYVSRAINIIKVEMPDVIGGPIYPFYLTEKPDWFKDEYEIRIHHDTSGPLPNEKYIAGSNMIFSKAILVKHGGFDRKLGMKGDTFFYGEETLLLDQIRKSNKNAKIWYDLEMPIKHLVPASKMNTLSFIVRSYNAGKSSFIRQKKLKKGFIHTSMPGILVDLVKIINTIHVKLEKKLLQSGSLDNNYIVEEIKPLIVRLGYLSGQFDYIVSRPFIRVRLLIDRIGVLRARVLTRLFGRR
jgi:glycosyltransferase involved in cell wall biosynthesis